VPAALKYINDYGPGAAQLYSLGGSRYEDIHMAFHFWVYAGLSSLRGIVLSIGQIHISRTRREFASYYSARSLPEYMDSGFSAALVDLRSRLDLSQRVDS